MNGKAYIAILKPLKISKVSIKTNKKVFKGPNFKKGNKIYLLTKKFKSKRPSKNVTR